MKFDQLQAASVTVSASRTYDILIGKGLLAHTGDLAASLNTSRQALIVADDTVNAKFGDAVLSSLEAAGFTVFRFIFPHGEESKNFSNFIKILEFAAEHKLTRSDLIVALGGGVTGDMAGFAASAYLRGIPFIQIPTTLLAAVDSSVGGKTAVNLSAGKNLAGAFYQPSLVICDYETILTLPDREFSSGMAEVIKYGVLSDPELFEKLRTEPARDNLEWIIERCVTIKRDVVMKDEFDTGLRQTLNLGHTLAHAIEKLSSFSISHGQAVAIGMAEIARAAWANGLAEENCAPAICETLERYGLPTACPYSVDEMCGIILNDKKRAGQTLTLVIPKKIGTCILHKINIDEIQEFLNKQ